MKRQDNDAVLADIAAKQQASPNLSTSGKGSKPKLSFQVDRPAAFRRAIVTFYRRCTAASTGSPSDGLATLSNSANDTHSVTSERSVAGSAKHRQGVNLIVEDSTFETAALTAKEDDESQTSEQSGGATSAPGLPAWTGIFSRIRWHLVHFFLLKFEDEEQEIMFQKERWYAAKAPCICLSLFLILNWLLYISINKSLNTFDINSIYSIVVYYSLAPALTFPLPLLVAWNIPVKWPILFQLYFSCSLWIWGIGEIFESRFCSFWSTKLPCDEKNFLAMMYYLTSLPTMGLFVYSTRAWTSLFATAAFILQIALILDIQGTFARVTAVYLIYTIFYILFHFWMEKRDRRIFRLNVQLKKAYRAQQKAQMRENEAANSKRRFISYVFHEVRVPLNTAMLAFQNLHDNKAFRLEVPDNKVEVHALELSHNMMSKVLDDTLDLYRIDAGKFDLTLKPFALHRDIGATLNFAKAATNAKNLLLLTDLDPEIDKLQQQSSSEGLYVVGDSSRLRQIITNLTSNAIKFTSKGHVKISTKLIAVLDAAHDVENTKATGSFEKSELHQAEEGEQRSSSFSYDKEAFEEGLVRVVIRFSVEDQGPGLSAHDLQNQKLFKPFSQTSSGAATGKGSGLGLSIVRQLVKLSEGRLGLVSEPGKGSTFWFEMAFFVASQDAVREAQTSQSRPIIAAGSSLAVLDLSLLADGPPSPQISVAPPSSSLDSNFFPPFQRSGSYGLVNNSFVATVESPLTVLVMDDDPLTRKLLTRMLKRLGCIVTSAENGQIGLSILLGTEAHADAAAVLPQYFDCIFMDNQMPIKTGLEVVSKLREADREDLVIGCTGNALQEDQDGFVSAGADEVLTKPIKQADLKRLLQVAVNRRSSIAASALTPL